MADIVPRSTMTFGEVLRRADSGFLVRVDGLLGGDCVMVFHTGARVGLDATATPQWVLYEGLRYEREA